MIGMIFESHSKKDCVRNFVKLMFCRYFHSSFYYFRMNM